MYGSAVLYVERSGRHFFRKQFGPELPKLFVDNWRTFGMNAGTPEDGVQIQFHDFGEDDINAPSLWIKVQFSEEVTDAVKRIDIRQAVFSQLANTFRSLGVAVPANFMLDVFWGPTHGCGRVNGKHIGW